jgi:dTDP-4-amino-4,6-dideoxygalactose transaminase
MPRKLSRGGARSVRATARGSPSSRRRAQSNCPAEPPADRPGNGHIFYILVDTIATRMGLAAHLKVHDMLSVSHYVPLHSSPGGRKFGRASGSFKVTDDISDRLLRLPIYFGLTDAQV